MPDGPFFACCDHCHHCDCCDQEHDTPCDHGCNDAELEAMTDA